MSGMKGASAHGRALSAKRRHDREEQLRCLEKRYDHNQTRPPEQERRQKPLREMFAEIGGGCYIEPPLHADRGGHHVHFGSNV